MYFMQTIIKDPDQKSHFGTSELGLQSFKWVPSHEWVIRNVSVCYRNDPKFSDRYAWANSADPDQTAQSDQGLHCLPFRLHRLD